MAEQDEADAKRYRFMREMAITGSNLEALVALNQLDYIVDDEGFDSVIDAEMERYHG
jgi:hypothetical protein